MNRERIAYAITLADKIKDPAWNYGTWAEGCEIEEDKSLPLCGTTACYAGWMGLDPQIQAEGFHIDRWGMPKYGKASQTQAVADYLGLTYEEAAQIFLYAHDHLPPNEDGEYPTADDVTPRHVADMLQKLLDA